MNLLRIVILGEEDPHYTITIAFQEKFDKVDTIWWNYHTPENLDLIVRQHFEANKYDAVFMQLQTDLAILPETVAYMSEKSLVFNWTGDVREELNYFTKYGSHVITLFTNETDVNKMISYGYRSDYLQTGYDHKYYYCTNEKYKYRQQGIVFCGNNYSSKYPLSEYRIKAVRRLATVFKEHFVLYGSGWSEVGINSSGVSGNVQEARLYNYCSIAINLSHFNYKRYSSDRLFRELACGSMVLTHNFQDYEKDFVNEKHFAVWNDIDDLIDKCDNYLSDNKKAREIAYFGMQEAEKNYRWTNVVDNFIQIINKYK
jgi:glycosyltransferase involved in cell wall biosynthesis